MMTEDMTSGLLAMGKSGNWSVDIDELTKGSQTLFGVILSYPTITLQFSIVDLAIIRDIVNFLSNLELSCFKIERCLGGSLHLVFDEERLCIRQISVGGLGETELFEVKFGKEEIPYLMGALKNALDDL